MQLHPKRRLEIVIERPLLRRLETILKGLPATGYTVLPVLSGRGHEGDWQAAGAVGDAGQMVAAVCIVDPSALDAVLAAVFPLVERQIGIVSVSDVAVVRSEHF